MKTILFILITGLLPFLLLGGCKRELPQKPSDKDTKEHITNKAVATFDENNGLNSHKNYDISIDETKEEWNVHFDGKTKLPGDHAFVIINKDTDEIKYFQGE